jgi:hypothetical protein
MSEVQEGIRSSADDGPSYWQNHLESWRGSGLTQAEYCRRHHLKYTRFRKWKERLCNYYPLKSSVKLVEVRHDLDLNVQSLAGRSGTCSRNSSGIRFWLGEFCIEIESSFSCECLSRLIETLENVGNKSRV